MDKIIECVPNFSEGKEKSIINAISAAIESVEGVKLLDVDKGVEFNRTVYTFVGKPEPVLDAAFKAAKVGIALIDMTKHKGEHARMGALDVCPFIPIKDVTDDECIELSKKFGKKLADELGIPVFLYAKSATRPDRLNLPEIRKGEYEALEKKFNDPDFNPDFGKPIFIPKSGATTTGCRDVLIAYNVNLNTNNKIIASKISGKIRTSGTIKKDKEGKNIIDNNGKPVRIPGRFKYLQAGGMMYNEDIAQVSMNLLNYKKVNLNDVFEAVKEEALKLKVNVTGSEIVGLIPKESLVLVGKFYSKKDKIKIRGEEDLVAIAIEKLGLSELYQFNPSEKIIEYLVEEKGYLSNLKINCFLSELASSSPAPGGGSVAALVGALGAALSSMVCNLTIGNKKYLDVQDEIRNVLKNSENIRKNITNLIDKDTEAFDDVMKAFRMPKDTNEQKIRRSNAIQESYKKATKIPFKTAKICNKIFDLSLTVAQKGNQNSITDAAISAIMAKAGIESAILNVKINLNSIKDEEYVKKVIKEIKNLDINSKNKIKEIEKIIKTVIS